MCPCCWCLANRPPHTPAAAHLLFSPSAAPTRHWRHTYLPTTPRTPATTPTIRCAHPAPCNQCLALAFGALPPNGEWPAPGPLAVSTHRRHRDHLPLEPRLSDRRWAPTAPTPAPYPPDEPEPPATLLSELRPRHWYRTHLTWLLRPPTTGVAHTRHHLPAHPPPQTFTIPTWRHAQPLTARPPPTAAQIHHANRALPTSDNAPTQRCPNP